jgi:hypothetical protein
MLLAQCHGSKASMMWPESICQVFSTLLAYNRASCQSTELFIHSSHILLASTLRNPCRSCLIANHFKQYLHSWLNEGQEPSPIEENAQYASEPAAMPASSQRLLPGTDPARTDLQRFLKEFNLTPQQTFNKLVAAKATGRASWWSKFVVVFVSDLTKMPSGKQAMLQCKDCGDNLSAVSPAGVAATHFDKNGMCKKPFNPNRPHKRVAVPPLTAGSQLDAAGATGSASSFQPQKHARMECQQTRAGFMVPARQQQQAIKHIMSFLFKRCKPSAVEDPDLVASFSTLGCKLPDRRSALGPWLDTIYEETKQEVEVHITSAVEASGGSIGALATDGWKRKAAEQGVPLINVNLLLPDGGSAFIKVRCSKPCTCIALDVVHSMKGASQ